jgi:cytochrome c-type biogenesis protein CcmF
VLVSGYEFRFDGVQPMEGPNYDGIRGTLLVTRQGTPVGTFYPEKRHYFVQGVVTTESAIRMTRATNLLLALGDDLGAGRWSVRIQVRPLMSLVWFAALFMAVGGAVAGSDRRYRLATRRAAQAAPAAAAAREPVG